MIGALSLGYCYNPSFLQQIAEYIGTFYSVVLSEKYLYVLAKTTRVVVTHCFTVAECLK